MSISFVRVDDNIVDWKQLLLMSLCHHNIIANSSFGWWAAYLNNYINKIVIYPSEWFGSDFQNKNVLDMFPPTWVKIDSSKIEAENDFKFYIIDQNAHHKNVQSIENMMIKNKVKFTRWHDLSQLDDTYDVVLSLVLHFEPHLFPKSIKVLYGPHFFVFPDDTNHKVYKYVHDSSRFFYNTLSDWNRIIHKSLAPKLALQFINCPFGLDIENIKQVPSLDTRTKVMVYFKLRHPDLLHMALTYLSERNISYYLIQYGSYKDEDFKELLQDTRFVIWIGRHESQGFAFQETLASNVPILLWDVRSMYDEYSNGWIYESRKTSGFLLNATVAPIWSDKCGIKFYDREEFENAFHEMNKRLDTFAPRQFMEPLISLESTYANLLSALNLSYSYTTSKEIGNLVLITSIIDPPNYPLSYASIRSVYNCDERFEQTKKTIQSIKAKVPNNQIMLVECSNLRDYERDYFLQHTDIMINLYDRHDQDIIDKIYSKSKAKGEGTMTIEAVKYLQENNITYRNFFKISGRYWLNDNFNYEIYDNSDIVYKLIDADSSLTSLYKLPYDMVNFWYKYLLKSTEEFNNCISFEDIFNKFIQSTNMNYIDISELGISGYIAVCGSLISK